MSWCKNKSFWQRFTCTALDLDENKKYESLPMLESSLYSYVLQLANDSSHLQLKDEGKAVEGLGTIW